MALTGRVLAASMPVWHIFVMPEPCLIFRGAVNAEGYGVVWGDGRTHLAHRVTYGMGRIPEGLTLDHLCGQTRCVEITHLDPVTREENLRRARKAICRAGLHDMTGDNVRLQSKAGRSNPSRVCRACDIESKRKARQ